MTPASYQTWFSSMTRIFFTIPRTSAIVPLNTRGHECPHSLCVRLVWCGPCVCVYIKYSLECGGAYGVWGEYGSDCQTITKAGKNISSPGACLCFVFYVLRYYWLIKWNILRILYTGVNMFTYTPNCIQLEHKNLYNFSLIVQKMSVKKRQSPKPSHASWVSDKSTSPVSWQKYGPAVKKHQPP